MADNTHTIHYARVLQVWPTGIGPKPTSDSFATAHALMKHGPGAKHALAMAMFMRPKGATAYEHRVACAMLDDTPLYDQGVLFNFVRARLEGHDAPFTRNMNAGHRLNPQTGKTEPVWQVALSEAGRAEIARRAPAAAAKAATKAAPLVAAAKAAKAVTVKPKAVKPKLRKGKAALPYVTVTVPAEPEVIAVDVPVNEPVTDQPQA